MEKMPNENGGHYGHDSMKGGGKKVGGMMMGTNKGASGGLKKSDEMRADVTKSPTTTNRYPRGLA